MNQFRHQRTPNIDLYILMVSSGAIQFLIGYKSIAIIFVSLFYDVLSHNYFSVNSFPGVN